MALSLLIFGGNAHSAQLEGRSVGEVLGELQAQSLHFIFSSETIPAQLRVMHEPHAQRGIELAREILAEHALMLVPVAPGTYSIVRDPKVHPAPPVTSATLEEVVVQASVYAIVTDSAVSHAFLTQEQVKAMPRLADETLRAVQHLPGVATNGFSSLNSIRGGEPGETAILLDGLRLYEPFHLKNFLSPVSLLDSRLIDHIDVYSGGYPAVYGDRMSAIIDTTSIHPETERYYELGLSLFHTSGIAYSEFMDGRADALVSARRSNIGELVQFSENDFGRPEYSDAFARLNYRASDDTRAAFNFLVSRDRIDAVRSKGTERSKADYRNTYSWATLQHDWSARADSRLIGSFTDITNQRGGTVNEVGRRSANIHDDRAFHVAGLRVDNRFDGDTIAQRYGAEVRKLWGHYDYRSQVRFEPGFPFPDSPGIDLQRTLSPAPQGYETSAYWDGKAPLGSRWTVQAGLRFDTQTYDGSGDSDQWSPRLSLLYSVSAQTRVRASWGRFFQSQGINELQVEDGVERFYQAQYADHAILSVEHAFDPAWSLRVEGYRKFYRRVHPRYENLFDPLVLLPETQFDRVMIDPQSASAEGLEILLRLQSAGPWSGWLSYTWSRVEDRIDGRDVPRSWDQRHAVNLGVAWTRGPWSATITDSFHTGWPTTLLQLSPAATPEVSLDARNSSHLSDYNSLDFRVTRTFDLPRGMLDVFVEATNAFSDDNPCCVQYAFKRDANGAQTLDRNVDNWLPLVPSAGVLWRY
ncbi:MAG: TonB-dependent receptor [Steroidobacteraceae bacterium]